MKNLLLTLVILLFVSLFGVGCEKEDLTPQAPANLELQKRPYIVSGMVAEHQYQVDFYWNDVARNEDGFIIRWQRKGDHNASIVDTVMANSTYTSHAFAVSPNSLMIFSVTAYNAHGESERTEQELLLE